MRRIRVVEKLSSVTSQLQKDGNVVGFVPTMGALHQGHVSLVLAAKELCDVVVVSIFVNPTQFNDSNDLDSYPKTEEQDCKLLEEAGCEIVFIPTVSEMYTEPELQLKAEGIEDLSWMEGKTVDFGTLANVMEGAHRPGHFNGVAQVVSKLFRIVNPNKAFFGQKDFQQLAIVRSVVKQLQMNVEIVGCPIVREENGLAMSSRNMRLSEGERSRAAIISKVLFKIKDQIKDRSIDSLLKEGVMALSAVNGVDLEYLEIVDANTLQTISSFDESKQAVACVALKLGDVRLIDNCLLV